MSLRRGTTESGFTLIELIIAVAIIAILAAVAIPMLRGYIVRSKASEAFEVLQGIREKEEAYYANFKRYTTDGALGWYPRAPAACVGDTVQWPGTPAWRELGFAPSGPVYYAYQVRSNFDANGSMNANSPRDDVGTDWTGFSGPWFQAEASGDIDDDGQLANFHISSRSNKIFHQQAPEPVY